MLMASHILAMLIHLWIRLPIKQLSPSIEEVYLQINEELVEQIMKLFKLRKFEKSYYAKVCCKVDI